MTAAAPTQQASGEVELLTTGAGKITTFNYRIFTVSNNNFDFDLYVSHHYCSMSPLGCIRYNSVLYMGTNARHLLRSKSSRW